MSAATSAGERSRCYSHIVVHCSTWCVFMKKKEVCNWALPGKDRGGLNGRIIQDGRDLAQLPSQSFWLPAAAQPWLSGLSSATTHFIDLRVWGAESNAFFLCLSFLFPTKWVWLGSPSFPAHISTLHPTPVWVAGRIWLSVSWMNNWIGSSSKSHHPTAAMSF